MGDVFHVREHRHCSHPECTTPTDFWVELVDEVFDEMGPHKTETEAKEAIKRILSKVSK